MTLVWCELALIGGRPEESVLINMVDGRFTSIEVGVLAVPGDAIRLSGFTLPGFANAHSHAFHRALRSRTQADRGTFWTWREVMYRAAVRLEPDSYHRLARATFGEMVTAGISCVGEFHYLHHQADGTRYRNPNAMGEALLAAASDAGLRITLLDTLYLHGGFDVDGYMEPAGAQLRFSDDTAEAWVERVDMLKSSDSQMIAAAIHSVRAVDPNSMGPLAEWAGSKAVPVHSHVSEQLGENETCLAHHGMSPLEVLAEAGVLESAFSAVHATHVNTVDIGRLAAAGSTVVMCPTTERDLGDGIGPTSRFRNEGIAVALGTDSQAIIDMFEEARALELDERLRRCERGLHPVGDLLQMATVNGHHSLGWHDAGTIAVGNRADLVSVTLSSIRTAGVPSSLAAEASVFAATAADVTDVYVDGRAIVSGGAHRSIDIASELDASIRELMDDD